MTAHSSSCSCKANSALQVAEKNEHSQKADSCKQTHTTVYRGTIRVSRYQTGKTNLDFTEARNSEWPWHQLGHIKKICTPLQADNHASTPPLKFFTGRMPFMPPNQQCQSTEDKLTFSNINFSYFYLSSKNFKHLPAYQHIHTLFNGNVPVKRGSAGNTTNKNSSVFSPVRMCQMPSATGCRQ